MYKNNAINNDVNLYFTESALPGLRAYFCRVQEGQSDVYTTPFAKGETTKELLHNWGLELKSLENIWPDLYAFEEDMASKVGPMSVMKPLKARIDDVKDYFEGIHLPSKPILHSAVAAVVGEWKVAAGLNIRSQRRTMSNMKLSTNSGSPYFTKRNKVLTKTLHCTVVDSDPTPERVMQYLPDMERQACAVLGWRGQEGGMNKEDVKQRVVWMFPFAVNLCELQVYQPLIEAAQRFNLVPAWVSMEQVDKRVTEMFDSKGSDDLVICTDFTKFDQHFNIYLQNAAESIIGDLFNVTVESWLADVFPIKYNIPIMCNFGSVMYGRHGMASGSGGTNADETLAHRALQYEAAILDGARLNPYSQCLGDDGVLTYPGITIESIAKAYQSHGLEMNLSKQYAAKDNCIYLRRWHNINYRENGICVGVYSTMRALGRLRYLERYQDPKFWGAEAVALRQLSILENVKYHPLRDQFAEFCMKRDKYRLGIDIPGFLSNLESKAQKFIENMPDFLGYTKSQMSEDPVQGINNWWIVNYLKSRA